MVAVQTPTKLTNGIKPEYRKVSIGIALMLDTIHGCGLVTQPGLPSTGCSRNIVQQTLQELMLIQTLAPEIWKST